MVLRRKVQLEIFNQLFSNNFFKNSILKFYSVVQQHYFIVKNEYSIIFKFFISSFAGPCDPHRF